MKPRIGQARILVPAAVAVLLAVAFMAWKASRPHATASVVPVQAVTRQDIQVTIEATGTVEPIDLVEVKSKASGQIIRMPVEVGSIVRAGDLLAQIDKIDVQNAYDQAAAALVAAQTKTDISSAQKDRSDALAKQGLLTSDQTEATTLDLANAKAALVKARTDLSSARQRLQDATVRAPVSGTILQQMVTTGQVIASATSSVSGGTTLLQMADLGRIRLRALVSETDIGSVLPGQVATVTVDAFPQHPFEGVVEKIEPQAVVQQSVTMFPVLITITNERNMLLPGMNGEVSMLIAEHNNVLAVPIEALRSTREAPAIATALGLSAEATQASIKRQVAELASARSDSTLGASARNPAHEAGAAAGKGASGRGRRGAAGAGTGAGAGAGTGATAGFTGGGGGARGTGGGARSQQVVFIQTASGLEPRLVRVGLTNFDYSQITSGLNEGDQVALLSVAELQAKRQDDQARMKQRMGSGMPGVATTGNRAAGASGGSAGRTGGR